MDKKNPNLNTQIILKYVCGVFSRICSDGYYKEEIKLPHQRPLTVTPTCSNEATAAIARVKRLVIKVFQR